MGGISFVLNPKFADDIHDNKNLNLAKGFEKVNPKGYTLRSLAQTLEADMNFLEFFS
jgi:hypothetical protein